MTRTVANATFQRTIQFTPQALAHTTQNSKWCLVSSRRILWELVPHGTYIWMTGLEWVSCSLYLAWMVTDLLVVFTHIELCDRISDYLKYKFCLGFDYDVYMNWPVLSSSPDSIVCRRTCSVYGALSSTLSLARKVYPAGGQSWSWLWVTNRTSVLSQSPWLKNNCLYDDSKVTSSSIIVFGTFWASPSSASLTRVSSSSRFSSHGRQGLFPSR